MSRVSVIIPVYNVEKYLEKCLNSVINQTYKDLEILLIDDGSTDKSPEICDEYSEKDSRIKVIHKENGGLSDARNTALDIMTGEYLTFVDSDDYIAVDAIETLLDALKRNGADLAVGNMTSFYEDGHTEKLYFPTEKETVLIGEDLFSMLSIPCAQNRLYKSGLYSEIRFPYGKLYEDLFVFHKVLSNVKCCVLTGKPTYFYFVRQGSIMHSKYNIRFTDVVFALKDRCDWLDSIGQTKLANETRMFIYTRTAAAFANLDMNSPENRDKLKEVKAIYDECFKILIREKIGIKQKIRLIMLYKFPSLHTKLFGKKMPIALG